MEFMNTDGDNRSNSYRHIMKEILIIDVESTCWDKTISATDVQISEIIEVGMSLFKYSENIIERIPSIFIKPQFSTVSQFCENLTGITQDKLDNVGIPFPQAIETIELLGLEKYPWASWGDYDRKIFHNNCQLHNVPYPWNDKHTNIKQCFSDLYLFGKKRCGMKEALNLLKMPLIGQHHSGGDDAYNIARILQRMTKDHAE